MRGPLESATVKRLLVVPPNWVGDVVLASPALAALRRRFSTAHITYLLRANLGAIVAGAGWHDAELHWPSSGGARAEWGLIELARRLRSERFDAVILLTNSFRSAAIAFAARIPRRFGYARDGRGLFLTDSLAPAKSGGRFTPVPVTHSYSLLAERAGAAVVHRKLALDVTSEQEQAGAALLEAYGLQRGRYAVVSPGGAFGSAKCWPPERFAQTCRRLGDELDLDTLVVGAPAESELLGTIAEQGGPRAKAATRPPTTLGALKPLVRDAALLVCNDSGPRHFGLAFEVPTVTVFGPTDPAWTDTGAVHERIVRAAVPCSPCQLRTCPIDHRCMTEVTVQMVIAAAKSLLRAATQTVETS